MNSFVEKALLEAIDASAVVAHNESVAIVLGYSNVLGTAARRFPQLSVAANGDLRFYIGSNAAAYSIDTLISAPTTGIVDVSDGSYNTIGEVVDYINTRTAASGWRAFPLDALRSDSSNNTIRAQVRTNNGLQVRGQNLLFDTLTAAVFHFTRTLTGPREFKDGIHSGRRAFADQKPILRGARVRVDYSSGQLELRVYERLGTTETLRTRVTGPAGGATVTEQGFDFSNGNDVLSGLSFGKGSELIVRAAAITSFSTVSSGFIVVHGAVQNHRQ